MSITMQNNIAYTNHGVDIYTNVNEGGYSYVDTDVIQDPGQYEELQNKPNQYEELRRKPQPPQSRTQQTLPVQSVNSQHETCWRRPPCWAWALIVLCVIIALTMVALLVFFLTNTTSTSMTSDTSVTTITSITNLPNRDDPTSTTGPATTRPTTPLPSPSTLATTTLTPQVTTTTTAPRTTQTTMTPVVYRDCSAAYNDGKTTSGVYRISPDAVTEVDVYCEQEIDGGGWTVFQRRMDGSVNFYRNLASYKNGFGSVNGEYWLGNDVIHLLTVNLDQKLKVELQNDGLTAYADYSKFWIQDQSGKYKLYVDGFSDGQNNPGDALSFKSGWSFSTADNDRDRWIEGNCAASYRSAWWYNQCSYGDLNAPYDNPHYKWHYWTGHGNSLDASRMMIKRR